MVSRCPGQDGRNLKVSLHKCPGCGYEVELFSDETRIKCRNCGTYVYKEQVPTCVEWCSKARECLGEEHWKELKINKEQQHDNQSITKDNSDR